MVVNPAAVGGNLAMSSNTFTTTTTSFNNMVNTYSQGLSGYRVRNNEKVVYTYHFRTSKYNTLATKTAAMTSMGTEHTSTNNEILKEYVKPLFGGEGFDVYDVDGFTYGSTGQYEIKPLISLRDARTDAWNSTWSTPVLYDYYAQLKQSICTELELERSTSVQVNQWGMPVTTVHDSPDLYIGIPPDRTVRFAENYTQQPLSDADVLPFDPNNLAIMDGSMAGAAPASSKLKVLTPSQTSKDFLRLKTITADALVHCNPNATERYWPVALEQAMLQFRNTTFKPLYRGNYQVIAYFQGPGACTPFSDWGQAADLSSGTITYPLPTGTAPPTAMPMGGTSGSGILQQP